MDDPGQTFKEHIRRGELWLQYCTRCRQFIFYPRSQCPGCWSRKWEWRPCRGQGRVYSYSTVYQSPPGEEEAEAPYIYALVTLDEGVRLATRLVDCDPAAVYIDMEVTMIPDEGRDQPRLMFWPLNPASDARP